MTPVTLLDKAIWQTASSVDFLEVDGGRRHMRRTGSDPLPWKYFLVDQLG
jgi:hypothetical protein